MSDYIKLAYAYGNLKAKTAELSNEQMAGLALGGTALGGGLMYLNRNRKRQQALQKKIEGKNRTVAMGTAGAGLLGGLYGGAYGSTFAGNQKQMLTRGALGALLGTGLGVGSVQALIRGVKNSQGYEDMDAFAKGEAEKEINAMTDEEVDSYLNPDQPKKLKEFMDSPIGQKLL